MHPFCYTTKNMHYTKSEDHHLWPVYDLPT